MFAPTAHELLWAKTVLARKENGGAFVIDGKMVDAPVVAQARRIVARCL